MTSLSEPQLNAIVIEELSQFGLSVEPIPTRPNIKTADLVARDGEDTFYIEAKVRDRSGALSEITADLEVGAAVAARPEPVYHDNSRSSVVSDGVQQLNNSTQDERHFRLLWLQSSADDPTTDFLQYEGTLCGQMHLLDTNDPDQSEAIGCYFFTESSFFRHRNQLDGAFLTQEHSWILIPNPYSPRYEALLRTRLVAQIGSSVWDPRTLEQNGKVLVADFDCDRSNTESVLLGLARKYGRRYVQVELQHYAVYARVT